MSTIKGLSRRAAVKAIGATAITAGSLCQRASAQDYRPQKQAQLTQAAAHYQDQPKNNESCASCPYFVLPNGCVVVEGSVNATGWCPMYTQFAPMDRGAHL